MDQKAGLKKRGKLILVPTPISPSGVLCPQTWDILSKECLNPQALICIEGPKTARRRWVSWQLPKAAIEKFIPFNEHTQLEQQAHLMEHLCHGGKVFLLSDAGLPAFCDPGQELVAKCHDEEIQVSATPFAHSVALALALSGFSFGRYVFEGFPPRGADERQKFFKSLAKQKELSALMDTPYRLEKVLQEVESFMPNRTAFLACNLGQDDEFCKRAVCGKLRQMTKGLKAEFILCLAPLA